MIANQFIMSVKNPIIGNHKVYGQELLPGLAYVDLIFQLFRVHHYSYTELELHNLTIYNPLTVGQDYNVLLSINCTEIKDGQWNIVVEGQEQHSGTKAKKRYVTAEMYRKNPIVFEETLELNQIKQLARRIVSLDEIYEQCQHRELVHTGFMKAEGRIYDVETAAIIEISIGQDALPNAADLMFHPTLIDGSGVGSGVLFSSLLKKEQELFLPIFYESFRASALMQRQCVTRIQASSIRRKKELVYLTMEFFNESGQKVAELKNLASKLIRETESINVNRQKDTWSVIVPQSINPSLSYSKTSIKESHATNTASTIEAEAFIQQLMAERLKKPIEQIETHVGYYEMGLDSPGLLEVVKEIGAKIKTNLPPTLLFEYTTIAELSAYLTENYSSQFNRYGAVTQEVDQKLSSNAVIDDSSLTVVVEERVSPKAFPVVSAAATVPEEEIAVIGMAGRFPKARNVEEFWINLREGRDCISEIPESRWDWRRLEGLKSPSGKDMSRWGGFIDDPDCFDPHFFRISPREAEAIDPQERLFLETCWEAIEDAGYTPKTLVLPQGPDKRRRVGVFAGVMHKDYTLIGAEAVSRGQVFPLSLNNAPIANRVSYFCNFHGPSMAVDTVCSSSLTAVHLALESIRRGECEAALAGGVNLSLHPGKYISYGLMDLHASDGYCHTFGKGGDGYVSGEGIGAVLLKPLHKAIRDKDHIYAVIKGSAVNHVGTVSGITVPSPVAQADVIVTCLEKTGINPRTISYVEAHGTGTYLGDPIEIQGLVKAYRQYTQDRQFCSIGSVKSNIGHAESAAGISALIKTILQLCHKILVPSLHAEELNPYIDFKQSPFYIQHQTEEWKQPVIIENGQEVSYPRRAGLSSFGATGSNTHIILEEYLPKETQQQIPEAFIREANPVIVPLSAKNEERLQAYAEKLLEFLKGAFLMNHHQEAVEDHDLSFPNIRVAAQKETEKETSARYREINLRDLAYTLQVGREAMEERVVFLVNDMYELIIKLELFAKDEGPIDNCWQGQVKNIKETVKFLNTDQDFMETIHKWIAKGKVREISESWVKGFTIDWELFYGETKPQRISLPTYPFARERYWVPEVDSGAAVTISPTSSALIHPLLHQNTSDIYGLQFSSTFTGREFFLKDYIVQSQRILPGVVCLEMARAAVEQAVAALGEGRTGIRIKNVVWDQAIAIAVGEQAIKVHIRLFPEDNEEIAYEIYSESEDVEPVMHSQGRVILDSLAEAPVLDLTVLQAQCNRRSLSSTHYYNVFQTMGIEYGPGYQGIEAVYVGSGQALAKLSLPSSISAIKDQFVLHPSLIDSALQASIGLFMDSGDSMPSAGIVPLKPDLSFALRELEIFSDCSSAMWALIRFGDGSQEGGKTQLLDIDLCNEQGNVCVRMRGLSPGESEGALQTDMSKAVSFENSAERRQPEPPVGNVMLYPVWESIASERGQNLPFPADRVVIIGGNKDNRNAIQKFYPQARVLEIQVRDTIDEITKIIEVHGPIEHILWIAPDNSLESLVDDALIEEQNRGVLQVFRIIKALLGLGYGDRNLGWTVITIDTQSVNKKDSVKPTHASLHGLIGSLAKEYPNWQIRLIDLEADCDWPVVDIFALPADRRGRPWAYRNNEWYRQQLIPFQCPPSDQTLYRTGGVYIVIGGAGGVGEAWSEYMIRTYQARIIWIGRRQKGEVIQTKLERLAKLGPEPHYIAADATNRKALQQAYEEIKKQYSEIHGVIHSAMVISDRSLSKMEEEQFKAGLSAKVDVSVRIAQVFQKEHLDFVLFFSSMITFIKNPKQSHYASGCTFKDAFAHQLALEWPCSVKVMNWGYWGSDSSIAFEDYQQLARIGLGYIESEDGMKALEMLLTNPVNQIALMKTTKPLAVEGMNYEELIMLNQENISISIQNIQKLILERDRRIQRINSEMDRQFTEMEELLCKLLWGQLRSLGLFTEKKSAIEVLRTKSGVRNSYVRWLEESIAVLARKNYLQLDGESCIVSDIAPIDTDAVWKEWEQQKNFFLVNPDMKAWVILVDTTLRALPEILTGKVLATEIMFPNSSMELVEGIYKHNLIADYYNEILADTVVACIQERLSQDSSARIRIFEIGAGTGGTSTMVFQKIKPYRDHIQEYCYTDISKAFLMHAEKEYGPENPYLTYKIFNVEEPVAGQGITIGGYDIVIAANVLHATQNIRQTLRNAKAVLRKHGLIILNEMSSSSFLTYLTFGLLEGWWLYEDKALRIPGCPGLYPETWQKVLESEGFRSVFFPAQNAHDLGQQIVFAVSDGVVRQIQELNTGEIPVKQNANTSVLKKHSPKKTPQTQKSRGINQDLLRDKSTVFIKNLVGKTLKIPSNKIDSSEFLEIYGIDSILIVHLANALGEFLDNISSTLFFEYQTIDALVEHLMKTQENSLRKMLEMDVNEFDEETLVDNEINVPTVQECSKPVFRKSRRYKQFHDPEIKESDSQPSRKPVAIIGLSGRYPQAESLEKFWENLKAGKDCITEISEERWPLEGFYQPDPQEAVAQGKSYSKWGGFLDGFADFDPLFFNISPREAINIDPQERLFIESCWKVLEDAGYTRERLELQYNRRVGVFAGITKTGFNLYGPELWRQGKKMYPLTSFGSVANRISYLLNLQGPSMPIDTMCSSSLTAIHEACEYLRHGGCEMAIAGGVNLYAHPSSYIGLCAKQMLSRNNLCAAFGQGGNGFVPGEGVGCVLLKLLSRAEKDGDHIYTVILGSHTNHGGKTYDYMVPNPNAQRDLILENFKKSESDPRTISYVEAAALGSDLGDPIEVAALTKAFGQYTRDKHFCAIGSVKPNIGHLEAASGISQLTKVILQLQHQQLVPSIKAEPLNPEISFKDTPFYLQRELQEWKRPVLEIDGENREYPRRATVSSFGAGGVNTHLIVEEYVSPQEESNNSQSTTLPQIVVFSAKNRNRLQAVVRQILDFLEVKEALSLANLAYTLQVGREPMASRLAMVVKQKDELIEGLKEYLESVRENRDIEALIPIYTGDLGNEFSELRALFSGKVGENILQAILAENNLEKLAFYWAKGGKVSWELLHERQQVRRISLPTYPFEKRRCWIDFWQESIETNESLDNSTSIAEDASISMIESVVDIIARLLGMTPSEVRLNIPIVEYGFDSILMMQLLRQLQIKIDPFIDLGRLRECKTVQDIINILPQPKNDKQILSVQKTKDSIPTARSQFPELIHLNNSFQGRPVFWFHGGLGGVESYQIIAQKSQRPFYGIQSRGWMTNRSPLHGIQAMASYYVHIIQSVQPEGPYDLGGYSLGGILAYEVTRQLQELGQDIDTIVMLDSLDGNGVKNDVKSSQKDEILKAVNAALAATTQQELEILVRVLIHRHEVNLNLEDEEYLKQLVMLAKTRGLTKSEKQLYTQIQQNVKVQQAYYEDRFLVLPLPKPKAVTCYYFRNKSGLLLGELEPYFIADDKNILDHIDHTNYWGEFEQQLSKFYMFDVDSSNHMMILSEPKSYETIVSFCEKLYSEEGMFKEFFNSFMKKHSSIRGHNEDKVSR